MTVRPGSPPAGRGPTPGPRRCRARWPVPTGRARCAGAARSPALARDAGFREQASATRAARGFPRTPLAISYDTAWPADGRSPSIVSMSWICTNTSVPPCAGRMKPKPLSSFQEMSLPWWRKGGRIDSQSGRGRSPAARAGPAPVGIGLPSVIDSQPLAAVGRRGRSSRQIGRSHRPDGSAAHLRHEIPQRSPADRQRACVAVSVGRLFVGDRASCSRRRRVSGGWR